MTVISSHISIVERVVCNISAASREQLSKFSLLTQN